MSDTQPSQRKKSHANALEGKSYRSFGLDPNDVVIVGFDTDDGLEHPLCEPSRNALPVDEGLVRSLSRYGNVQDIVVRKTKGENSRIEVVIGRQRVKAMRVANQRLRRAKKPVQHIVARHQRDTDLTAVGKAITENAMRKDDSPMGKARRLWDLSGLGASDAECAVAFGVSTTAIRNWKKLLNLVPEVAEAVDRGDLSASAAVNLADLEPEQQVAEFKKMKEAPKKATFVETQRQRQNTTGSAGSRHRTAFPPPRKPILKKVSVLVASEEDNTQLSSDAAKMLDWVLGKVAASEIPGLAEALKAIEDAKKNTLSGPQQKLLDKIGEAPDGVLLVSKVKGRSLNVLIKLGQLEQFTHSDGLEYVRRLGTDGDTEVEAEVETEVETEVEAPKTMVGQSPPAVA